MRDLLEYAPRVRVLVVTHMWPDRARPGYGVFVRDQVEALRRAGALDVEVQRFPPGAASYLRAARTLWATGRDERYDVVHAHYGLSGWSALAARAPTLLVTFHGTDLRHPLVGPLSRLLTRITVLPATVSRSLARDRLPGAGRRRRVVVLPCGVELGRFEPLDRREARSRLGLEPGRPHLLFPAEPTRAVKRFDRARRLADRFPEARLLTLSGAVSPEEVGLWINASNAVLVTSEEEGFGLATLEALACDVPVLSTPVGIAPVALGGLEGTLCADWDEERWTAVLRAHLEKPDPRVAGRGRAALFSSERMAARVLAVYRELCASSDGHQRA